MNQKPIIFILFFSIITLFACQTKEEKAKAQLKAGSDYLRHSQFKEAIECFNKMIELTPGNDEAYFGRGDCWYNIKEYQKALDDFKKATELNPNNAQAFYDRGATYEAMGNVKAACPDWIKARDLGKPNMSDRIKICRQWGFQ
ncbi:MAG: tetratricopeptide repeat protein [Bacteroidota bacterium]